MAKVNANLTESVIRQIMEGADPRTVIDAALDEKAGYHKEKRIRDGKAQVVNVKNTKRKVHHTLTPDQKKAIKKAHSAAANKKRAKSLKKGAKMGLYKEGVSFMSEDEELQGLGIACPGCGEGSLEIFNDPDGEETDGIILVCPACGETFVICSTSELEDDDDEKDDDKDDAEKDDEKESDDDAEEKSDDEVEVAAEVEVDAESEEDAPQDESVEVPQTEDPSECGDDTKEECGDGQPEEESGLFFAQE